MRHPEVNAATPDTPTARWKLTAGVRIRADAQTILPFVREPENQARWDLRQSHERGFRPLTDRLPPLVRSGTTSWDFEAEGDDLLVFATDHYERRHGFRNRLVDLFYTRPLMRWMLGWSMDRLRLWIEHGVAPASSLPLVLLKRLCAITLALVWIYQGLVPKILFVRSTELEPLSIIPFLRDNPLLSLEAIGTAEILLGLWLLGGFLERSAAFISLFALAILSLAVAVFDPSSLTDPHGGLIKNLALVACAAVVIVLQPLTPSASRATTRRRK
jgi:uncharacterized membrane protein YphA (DoxX/SURF4 family)